jgi:hypothetical protein
VNIQWHKSVFLVKEDANDKIFRPQILGAHYGRDHRYPFYRTFSDAAG